jgi:hypothetical protein
MQNDTFFPDNSNIDKSHFALNEDYQPNSTGKQVSFNAHALKGKAPSNISSTNTFDPSADTESSPQSICGICNGELFLLVHNNLEWVCRHPAHTGRNRFSPQEIPYYCPGKCRVAGELWMCCQGCFHPISDLCQPEEYMYPSALDESAPSRKNKSSERKKYKKRYCLDNDNDDAGQGYVDASGASRSSKSSRGLLREADNAGAQQRIAPACDTIPVTVFVRMQPF